MTTDVYECIVSDETLAEHLSSMLARPDWHTRAACRGMGTAMFLPTQGMKSDSGKSVCSTCTVRSECLAFGRDGNEVGTWGGLSTLERVRVRMPSGSNAA
jgi:WhiB family transcriptional regulator, redox-sensing transcriptional regulator